MTQDDKLLSSDIQNSEFELCAHCISQADIFTPKMLMSSVFNLTRAILHKQTNLLLM